MPEAVTTMHESGQHIFRCVARCETPSQTRAGGSFRTARRSDPAGGLLVRFLLSYRGIARVSGCSVSSQSASTAVSESSWYAIGAGSLIRRDLCRRWLFASGRHSRRRRIGERLPGNMEMLMHEPHGKIQQKSDTIPAFVFQIESIRVFEGLRTINQNQFLETKKKSVQKKKTSIQCRQLKGTWRVSRTA